MIPQLRNNALDIGITEDEFWELTVGEINRRVESFNRVYLRQLQDKASIEYASNIFLGQVISRVISGEGTIPSIEDTYPALFAEKREALAQARQDEINAANFLQFAAKHNLKYKQGGEN